MPKNIDRTTAERIVEAITDDELRAAMQTILKYVAWESETENRNETTWGINGTQDDENGTGLMLGVYSF